MRDADVMEVQGLGVRTGDGVELVAGIDLRVRAGQVLGLIGETGAGKTLTARAMIGLLPAGLRAAGKVRLRDSDWMPIDPPSPIAKYLGRSIAIMLQNPVASFDPLQRMGHQLVEAVVRNGLMTKKEAIARAQELCEALSLGDPAAIFRLYPHQVSGGMAQRLALTVALMPQPGLLVADEPTSALDSNLRVDALKLLRKIATESGLAVVLISHDLGLVSHYCDSIAVLYAGHVAEWGPADDLLRNPAHPYTRTLVASSLSLAHPARTPLPTVGGEPPVPGHWPTGCYFHPRCPEVRSRCSHERPELGQDRPRIFACHYPVHNAAREAARRE